MSRMGKIIKSAKIKLTTPPKLIPPLHKTAAKGTLPTEQTKLTIATKGPTSGPSILAIVGLLEKKNAFQNELGTHAAKAPAMSSPKRSYPSRRVLPFCPSCPFQPVLLPSARVLGLRSNGKSPR